MVNKKETEFCTVLTCAKRTCPRGALFCFPILPITPIPCSYILILVAFKVKQKFSGIPSQIALNMGHSSYTGGSEDVLN